MVDFVHYWSEKAEITKVKLVQWIGIRRSKFYDWCSRYGKVNEHNGWIPRDHWLEDWEKEVIVEYYLKHPNEGYRPLTFMMLDEDVVAVSPTSVYRVLKERGLLSPGKPGGSGKGKGFDHPSKAHEHWHIDLSYINICGTFYYLCTVLDGYSRFIVHHEIRESMKTSDVEIVLQRAKEKYPHANPRIISDNGAQFLSRDFKHFIRLSGMDHVTTSPYYPQSNGKLERFHRTIKEGCIRKQTPLSLEDAKRITEKFVLEYNTKRLHSGIGYVTPLVKLEGREDEIFAERDRKLEEARERRKENRKKFREALKKAQNFDKRKK